VVSWWHQQYKTDQKESKQLKHPGSQSNFNIGSLLTFYPSNPWSNKGKKTVTMAFRDIFFLLRPDSVGKT